MARDSEITTTTEKNRGDEGLDVWDVAAAGLGAAAGGALGRRATRQSRKTAKKYKKSKFGSYRDEGKRLSRAAMRDQMGATLVGGGLGAEISAIGNARNRGKK